MANKRQPTVKIPRARCLLCDRDLRVIARLLRRRFCSSGCKAEYKNLMTNLALARLNVVVQAGGDPLAQNAEMKSLARMLQAEEDVGLQSQGA